MTPQPQSAFLPVSVEKEETIVRENLMTHEGYTPYCGNVIVRSLNNGCSNPRTKFNGEQFHCAECGWTSQFPFDFIKRYKVRWNKN